MAGEEPERLAWLRGRHCVGLNLDAEHRCSLREVHHPTQYRATGHNARRAHDRYGLPMCPFVHTELHMLAGHFKGWTGERLRKWEAERCIEQQAAYDIDNNKHGGIEW